MSTQTLERKREIPAPAEPETRAPAEPETPAPPSGPFSAAEAAAFRADDKHAAAAISGIMVAILSAGLMLYIFIACWVLTWPM